MTADETLTQKPVEVNTLFPVFLKPDKLETLLVGGGYVAMEKLQAIFGNCPAANVQIVGREISAEIKNFAGKRSIRFEERAFEENDLFEKDMVIVAIDDKPVGRQIYQLCKSRNLLVNVADTPELCDFYLSSVVQKGNLKIAISTNGKSPTVAKRVKEVLNETFPAEIDSVLTNMTQIRQKLNGDFSAKVKQLDEITAGLLKDQPKNEQPAKVKITRPVTITLAILSAISLMILGHLLFVFFTGRGIIVAQNWVTEQFNQQLLIYMLGGFVASLIDGACGMAYGVTSTTFLISLGIPPAAASASVHASEVFNNGTSGLMHWRSGNVNFKLFKKLLIPGIIGAVSGATILSSLHQYGHYLKPFVGCYTLFLGVLIIRKALNKTRPAKKIKRIGLLAGIGGLLDAIGGGGWGPIVTTGLIAGGRNVRYTIGTSTLTKGCVAFTSAVTFILLIGLHHFQVILGLVLGGMIAAPIAVRISNKLPVKTLLLFVGMVVILVSLNIISTLFLK
ncbi:MAG: TSUP family transporter [Janthinobacterium lividum]